MGVFRFKKFSVRNERSSMKVNTDGVLLGAAMTIRPSASLLLDIGTGTGVIALMAAQRLAEIFADGIEGNGGECQPSVCDKGFSIIGIDIDDASAAEAAENFAMSPWAEKLAAKHISLSDFEKECDGSPRVVEPSCDGEAVCTKKWHIPSDSENQISVGKFDMIFSNPPYFESSLKSPDERKRAARHAETMSYREIIAFASRHLASSGHLASGLDCNEGQHPAALPSETDRTAGRLSMILPYGTEREAVRYAASFNLRLFRRLRIRTTPTHPFSRVILEFTLVTTSPEAISNERTDKENPCLRNANPDFRNEDKPAIINDEITIQDPADRTADNPSGYTSAYRSLVSDFLLI